MTTCGHRSNDSNWKKRELANNYVKKFSNQTFLAAVATTVFDEAYDF